MKSNRVASFNSIAVACLCAALMASPVQAQTASGDKITIKMGVIGRPDQAPFELAYRRGYFERYGIMIDQVPANSGQEFPAALATEQLQVASGVPNAALFNAMNRGIDLRIVGDFAHVGDKSDRTVSIMVRSELIDSGTVKTVADLKGRSINSGPVRGQYPDLLWARTLALGGLKESDIRMNNLGFSDALAAMGSKTIDAAFIIEPLVTQAESKNIARILLPAGVVDSGATLSIVLFSPNFAKNRDAGTRFMAAFLMGARDYYDAFFLNKGREEAVKLLTTYLSVKDPALWVNARQATDLNGRVNIADLKRQAEFFKQQGTLSGSAPDFDRYVDQGFTEAAVKMIGTR
jgi:NitT/TauT family transport system substrate-binding protein